MSLVQNVRTSLNQRVPKRRAEPITEQQLSGWKLLERFIAVLDKHGASIAPNHREEHGLRDLNRRTYFGLFLFGLFNPVVTSMRALCLASKLDRVSGMLNDKGPVAISGFSDAQHVFAPEILEPVLRDLLAESLVRQTGPFKSGRVSPETIRIFDSTVWKVVTRMKWAEWRHQHCKQPARQTPFQRRPARRLPGHGGENLRAHRDAPDAQTRRVLSRRPQLWSRFRAL